MIELKNLCKVFGSHPGQVTALEGVDLKIGRGEIYGIIGLSGAGKSTLIRCINRLEEASSGEIYIDGQDIRAYKPKALNALRKSMGMIFQNFCLLESRSVYHNVSLSLELRGCKKGQRHDRIIKILQRVGLEDKVDQPIAHLSGGQKQRVAIARALVSQPKILLCDEATSALDPKTTHEILGLIKSLRDEMHLTVVIITHEMKVVEQVCDKVAYLDQGRVIKAGLVDQVLNDKALFQVKAV